MSAAGPGGAEHQTSQPGEDPAEYVRRIRSLPVDRVMGDVLFSLLQAAQVKVGRRDARLLIDVTAVAHEHARGYLPGDLTQQIDQLLGQLRMAQVSAEGKAGQPGQPEENDLDRPPSPPPASPAQ
jgi:hypothetical protein